MFSMQPALPPHTASGLAQDGERHAHDDDIALGFECANPALQIERWGQDEQEPSARAC